jgi:hypothetical protein
MGEETDSAYDDWLASNTDDYEEELNASRRRSMRENWHLAVDNEEPYCGPSDWRTKNRMVVVAMGDMSDHHLKHAIEFALKKPQHALKLPHLIWERSQRETVCKMRK